MRDKKVDLNAEYSFKGVPVSPGVAIGKAFLLDGETVKFRRVKIKSDQVDRELEQLDEALEKTRRDIKADRKAAKRRIGKEEARIFEMHSLLLSDPEIIRETQESIRNDLRSAEFAFYTVIRAYQKRLSDSGAEYFQDRIADLRDVKRRVIRNLQGDRTDYLQKLEGSAVIIARDLTPSDTIALDRHKILGFVTDLGGKTSHSAILARSFRVPAAVGMRHLTDYAKSGDRVILDGNEGVIYINPDQETLDYYRNLQKRIHEINEQLTSLRELPARTTDGKDIELAANLEFTDELENVKAYGGQGIGLYRTDFLYLARRDLPDEEEQYNEYRSVVEAMNPAPVIIRTLDVGGDKNPQNINIPPEENPYLGYRAIRICIEQPDIFLPQMRAILRASAHGNVKILFPMLSSMDELRETVGLLRRAESELRDKGVAMADHVEIGVMIEVPSAAIIADWIAEEVDFLSIGTNDLVQYMLAVDRGNERIAYLYQDLHPAVLRLIRDVVIAAHNKGTWVGMCGEMAGNPLATLILIGLGLDELSVSPIIIPEIKKIIRATDYKEAAKIAEKTLGMSTADEIESFMRGYMRRKFKDLVF